MDSAAARLRMVASASISGFCWTKLGDRYVVMGCLCGYEQIFLQKKCRRFPYKKSTDDSLHKVS